MNVKSNSYARVACKILKYLMMMFLHMNLLIKLTGMRLKGCTNQNPKRYNNVESAKNILDASIERHVKNAQAQEMQYLGKYISRNAERNFEEGSVNEIVSEIAVLGDR